MDILEENTTHYTKEKKKLEIDQELLKEIKHQCLTLSQ